MVKWEGYGTENNTWEYSENVDNAPEKVADFYRANPAAPRRIHALAFGTIPFRPISLNQASGRCLSRGGVIVRGTASASPSTSASGTPPGPSSAPAPVQFPSRLSRSSRFHFWLIFVCTTMMCHVTLYLTRSHYYSVISVALYITPGLQRDPHPFLFGSPARFVMFSLVIT